VGHLSERLNTSLYLNKNHVGG